MDFSENLRRLRLEKGWSQQALAEMLHVSPKTVSKWETGENRPDIDTVAQLARLCCVTTDSLLLGSEDEKPAGIPLPFGFGIYFSRHIPTGVIIDIAVADLYGLQNDFVFEIGKNHRDRAFFKNRISVEAVGFLHRP